jgi:hypothetical protein
VKTTFKLVAFAALGICILGWISIRQQADLNQNAHEQSGIRGRVTVGAACPSTSLNECYDDPYSGQVRIESANQEIVKVIATDDKGQFIANLPPGQYFVTIYDTCHKATCPTTAQRSIMVEPGKFVELILQLEVGPTI